jgi:23S rRNA (uracil1939-C5)-methyltransferase
MERMITCDFHDLSHDGQGVGRHFDKVVFVEGVLPQEKASIKVVREKKNLIEGKLVQLLKESPDRVNPVCPYFSQCGGCQIMHLSYEKQLEAKKNRVLNQIKKIAKFDIPFEVEMHSSPQKLHYRNKISCKLKDLKFGYYEKKSHTLLDIERCAIAQFNLQPLISLIRNHLSELKQFQSVTFRTNALNTEVTLLFYPNENIPKSLLESIKQQHKEVVGIVSADEKGQKKIQYGRSFIYETILDETFKVDALAFLQVNILQAERLYKKVLSYLNLKPDEIVVDAYCGIGILACTMGKTQASIVGFDVVKESIESAQENAKRLGLNHVSFFQEPFESAHSLPKKVDSLIINPPRSGCEKQAFDQVKRLNPKKVIYVSCDPATLARDLIILFEIGYSLKGLDIFDLFPQTMHVETLAYLEKTVE